MGRTPQQPRPIAVERDRTRVQGHLVYQKEKSFTLNLKSREVGCLPIQLLQ